MGFDLRSPGCACCVRAPVDLCPAYSDSFDEINCGEEWACVTDPTVTITADGQLHIQGGNGGQVSGSVSRPCPITTYDWYQYESDVWADAGDISTNQAIVSGANADLITQPNGDLVARVAGSIVATYPGAFTNGDQLRIRIERDDKCWWLYRFLRNGTELGTNGPRVYNGEFGYNLTGITTTNTTPLPIARFDNFAFTRGNTNGICSAVGTRYETVNVSIASVSNAGCASCNDWAGTHIFCRDASNPCSFSKQAANECAQGFPIWTALMSSTATPDYTLTVTLGSGAGTATYTVTQSTPFAKNAPLTLNLANQSDPACTWPASIQATPT